MAFTLATIAVTAVVVGAVAVLITRRMVTDSLGAAMGVRPEVDPAEEHRRLLDDAEKAAAAARSQVDLLQLSLDALSSGVIVTDESRNVLVKNQLAAQVSSRPHEQALLDAAVDELIAVVIGGESAEREIEVFGPPPRTLFVHAVPITADASVVGALAVIDDVTDHHRIEKTRRDFVANLSHELRTPIGAASLLGEMLVDEGDDETRKHLTDRLLIETDRMSATIDDLLELSSIESDTQSYDETFVVQQLVDEALARTRVAAESAHIDVGAVGPIEPIMMVGNRDQIVTAIVNLTENAIKYSSAGGSVSVRTRCDDDSIIIMVQDSGRGIPTRDQHRIFERFYRVDRSRESGTGGTGIGLSIVRHVALNHGGTVEVKSFEGEGSTFTITLPQVPTVDGSTRATSEVADERR